MDLVSYLEWLYRQDLVKIHYGQLPFLGLWLMSSQLRMILKMEVEIESGLARAG